MRGAVEAGATDGDVVAAASRAPGSFDRPASAAGVDAGARPGIAVTSRGHAARAWSCDADVAVDAAVDAGVGAALGAVTVFTCCRNRWLIFRDEKRCFACGAVCTSSCGRAWPLSVMPNEGRVARENRWRRCDRPSPPGSLM